MAIDPICGMTVDEASGLSADRDGETYYFCSEHCRRKFLAGDESAPAAGPPHEHPPATDHLVPLSPTGAAPRQSRRGAAITSAPCVRASRAIGRGHVRSAAWR